MGEGASSGPDWDRLYEKAATQEGLFTTRQAMEAGYSKPLLTHHVQMGRLRRIRRGIYRLTHFPAGEHEELVALWLWSDQIGTVSHQTALSLHGLSDVLPASVDLTVPKAWSKRRLRVPPELILHFADLDSRERQWFAELQVTPPARTLNDCALNGLSPELLRQATAEALRRGLVRREELGEVAKALQPFGGIEP